MSRNSKHKYWKEYLKLDRREDEIFKIRKELGYVELEKPYAHGFEAYLVLRDDIAKRKEADVYQFILDKYSNVVWSRDGKFIYKSTYKKRVNYVNNTPKIRPLTENEYLGLDAKTAKYFYHSPSLDKKYWDGRVFKSYRCNIPNHFFVMKTKVSYITHKKVVDSELEKEYGEVEARLDYFRETMNPYNKTGTWYRRKVNRRDRRHNKMALTMNIKTEICVESGYWETWIPWGMSTTDDPYPFRYKPSDTYNW